MQGRKKCKMPSRKSDRKKKHYFFLREKKDSLSTRACREQNFDDKMVPPPPRPRSMLPAKRPLRRGKFERFLRATAKKWGEKEKNSEERNGEKTKTTLIKILPMLL